MTVVDSVGGLVGVLRSAELLGFTKSERHDVACVYRTAYARSYRAGSCDPAAWAELVASQHVNEHYKKWQRLGYEVIDGEHRRSAYSVHGDGGKQ